MTIVKQSKASVAQLTLTEAATKHIIAYLDKEKHHIGVRFSVKKTGCSGFSYKVDYVQQANSEDIHLALSERYQIFIDKKSYPLLKGMCVDFVKQGFNSKFQFNNPNQTGACGCGESFTVDEISD